MNRKIGGDQLVEILHVKLRNFTYSYRKHGVIKSFSGGDIIKFMI